MEEEKKRVLGGIIIAFAVGAIGAAIGFIAYLTI
jgi:hypothetical protein